MSQSPHLSFEEHHTHVRELIDKPRYRRVWSADAVGAVSTATTPKELEMAIRYFLYHSELTPSDKKELLGVLALLSGIDEQ